ncbi:9282_t:CDS:1, partial [Racocetra fulgida]
MQENEELPAELVDLYEVSFISQTLEDLLAEEMFEDNDYDSDGDNTELSNDTSVINEEQIESNITASLQNKEKTRGEKKGHRSKNKENNA